MKVWFVRYKEDYEPAEIWGPFSTEERANGILAKHRMAKKFKPERDKKRWIVFSATVDLDDDVRLA